MVRCHSAFEGHRQGPYSLGHRWPFLAVSPEDGKSRHFPYRWKDKQKALGRAAILKSLSRRLAANASCQRIDRMRSALASNGHRSAGKPGVWKGAFSKNIYRVIGMPCRIDDPALGRFPRFDPFMRSMSYAQSEPLISRYST